MSVAELLAETGSVHPPGTAAEAVLTSVPVAAGEIVPVTTRVALPPASRSSVVATLPEPEEAPHAPTAGGTAHVQEAAEMVPGRTSLTVAPETSEGPRFDTVTV